MAVRTDRAGIKNKRVVGAGSALAGQGSTGGGARGKKTLPKEEAAAYRRGLLEEAAVLGPASKPMQYKRGRVPARVNGRKKAPSEMRVQRAGGPKKRSPLHAP